MTCNHIRALTIDGDTDPGVWLVEVATGKLHAFCTPCALEILRDHPGEWEPR
jgi:hypothetical protein